MQRTYLSRASKRASQLQASVLPCVQQLYPTAVLIPVNMLRLPAVLGKKEPQESTPDSSHDERLLSISM